MQDTSFEVCPECGATFVLPVYHCRHCENDAAQKLNTVQTTRESSIPVLNAAFVSDAPDRAPVSLWAARKACLVFFLVSVALTVVNHFVAVSMGHIYPLAVAIGPLGAGITLGGVIDPRIFLAVTERGSDLPFRFKVLGTGFALAGLAVSFHLAFRVYHLFGG